MKQKQTVSQSSKPVSPAAAGQFFSSWTSKLPCNYKDAHLFWNTSPFFSSLIRLFQKHITDIQFEKYKMKFPSAVASCV